MPRDLEPYDIVSSRSFEIRSLSELSCKTWKIFGFATGYSSQNMSHFIFLDHLNPPNFNAAFQSKFWLAVPQVPFLRQSFLSVPESRLWKPSRFLKVHSWLSINTKYRTIMNDNRSLVTKSFYSQLPQATLWQLISQGRRSPSPLDQEMWSYRAPGPTYKEDRERLTSSLVLRHHNLFRSLS